MDTKQIPPVVTPYEPPLPHSPQEEQQEDSGKSVLLKALYRMRTLLQLLLLVSLLLALFTGTFAVTLYLLGI